MRMSEDGSIPPDEQVMSSSACRQHLMEQPLVFQCQGCRTIVGDSAAWVFTCRSLKTITLHKVSSSIINSDEIRLSKEGFDSGSTYSILLCQFCGEEIGVVYKTTPPHLDDLRNAFSLYVDKLIEYEVGSNDHVSIISDTPVENLGCGIKKIHLILLSLSERLQAVEYHTGVRHSPLPFQKRNWNEEECTANQVGSKQKECGIKRKPFHSLENVKK